MFVGVYLTQIGNVIASMEAKLCFGAPEMFSVSQNYLSAFHPPKSGGYYAFILQIHSLLYKFYAPNNHINSPNAHS